jgi:hypothetical protein
MVRGERIPVLPHQIILWVSIGLKEIIELEEGVPRIPAILDTGNTFGFSIAEHQLVRWCDLHPDLLVVIGSAFINRQRLNRHAADVWVHRNRRKQRDAIRSESPFRLELRDGIAVYSSDSLIPGPRLLLLGLRAMDENALRCTLNGKKRTITLSTDDTA